MKRTKRYRTIKSWNNVKSYLKHQIENIWTPVGTLPKYLWYIFETSKINWKEIMDDWSWWKKDAKLKRVSLNVPSFSVTSQTNAELLKKSWSAQNVRKYIKYEIKHDIFNVREKAVGNIEKTNSGNISDEEGIVIF